MLAGMHMPLWLLHRLPMFDYLCPRCKAKVGKDSRKCPWCGEDYGAPVRVPPRILKDNEKLESYVHKYIFPKIGDARRNYLSKYFTVVGGDNFESGNTNYWTISSTNGSSVISTTKPHHGAYSCYSSISAVASSITQGVKELSAAYAALYLRMYATINAVPSTSGNMISFGPIINDLNDVTDLFKTIVENSSGSILWGLYTINNANLALATWGPQPNEWYCMEAYHLAGSPGTDTLYVDGVSAATINSNNQGPSNAQEIGFRLQNRTGTQAFNAYFDCIVCADAYNGPEIPYLVQHDKWLNVGVAH